MEGKMKLHKSLIGLLCLFGFCSTSPDAFAPPPAPNLRIELTPTNSVLIAWSSNYASAALLQGTNINTTNWVSVTNSRVLVNNEYQVLIASTNASRFYRLSL
jgi:hypothetical protein